MTSSEKFESWCINRLISVTSMVGCDSYQSWRTRELWASWQAAETESEQKLTDMAVQLANAESKCRELAAEVQAVRWACGQVYMKGYNHGHLNTVDGLEYASDTELVERGGETLADFTDPDHCGVAADAILAEVGAQAVERLANAWYAIANETDAGINISDSSRLKYRQRADDAADFANEIRKEAAQ